MNTKILALSFFMVLFFSGCGEDENKGGSESTSEYAKIKLAQALPNKFSDIRKYYGKNAKSAAKKLDSKVNRGGNIVVDEPTAYMLLQTQAGKVQYMSLEINETSPCDVKKVFNADKLLSHAGINPNNLRLFSSATHNVVYMDDANKFKIAVTCQQNGVPLSISVSRKYYQTK